MELFAFGVQCFIKVFNNVSGSLKLFSMWVTDLCISAIDCRNASCIAVLDPCKAARVSKTPKEKISWVSCVAVDSSEKWLVKNQNCCTFVL